MTDKKKTIFITGATGFLGGYLMKRLLCNKDTNVIVLARDKNDVTAQERIQEELKYLYGDDHYKKMLDRVRVVEGEVDKDGLGLSDEIRQSLLDDVDEIYHSAAIAEFRIPLDEIRKINVNGTRNVCDFAFDCKARGQLEKINHISTVYVAGDRTGTCYENELDVLQGFHNTYEQSKNEAEALVGSYKNKGLDITIFRPSILTGDYCEGKTSNFKMLYQPLHFFANELFDAIPGDCNAQFNLMPVDLAADAICLLANKKESIGKTFHIACDKTVSLGCFVDAAGDYFGFKKPKIIPVNDFDMDQLSSTQKKLIEPYIPYFNSSTIFDLVDTKKILESNGFAYPVVGRNFLIKLFEYCDKIGFIKRKKRYVAAG